MDMIKHKTFGAGEVISKDIVGNYTCITARFAGGKEMRFVIPESFETGVVEAEGKLKDEVDKAIAEKRAGMTAAASSVKTAPMHSAGTSRKMPTKAVSAGPIAAAYEDYLINAGYRVETHGGNPSTVFSYIRAVEAVLSEEGLSWDTLKSDISNIVNRYDVGGQKELFGAKSNKTVINALKRFEEFTNTP